MTLHQLHSHSQSNQGPRYLPPVRLQRIASPSFFNNTFLQYLVDTNTYAQKKLASMTISSRSLYRNWRPVTADEMKGFIAVVLNMGLVQLTNLKDYWSTDDTTNFPFFRSVFSRDQFF